MEHGESGYIAKDGCIRVMTGVRWRDGRKFVKYGESEKKKNSQRRLYKGHDRRWMEGWKKFCIAWAGIVNK